ncbi:hypothetical protein [Crocosphaera sp. XPORK-15E]|uniref:hypothetical protein n=1 Tax=Crocosphaera sp. XPORK-15E TaxID=3110247 RepID=UPI002B200C0A|nr:hypothetical protein [Crocosphaera sp. XPORK-15E]MEA5533554.1 hypothetical protein [Crocosphaera sp. XPORK-15E]
MANSYRYYGYFSFSAGFGFLILVAFFVLQWLQIPAGNLIDWVIGVGSFWWLMVIITIPWNVYFDAKEVISEAATSQDKSIPVDNKQLNYVKTVSRGALLTAIALHLFSALGLYELAVLGISPVGYISSIATLLLTALRPAIRAYQYLAYRLSAIREQIKYPREDILELRNQVNQLVNSIKQIEDKLDLSKEESWLNQQQNKWKATSQEVALITVKLDKFEAKNKIEHEAIAQEAKNGISQLTEDSNFLRQVREIIRFIKTA